MESVLMEGLFVLLVALIIDLVFGEPPNSWHPVAWMGRLIAIEMKWAPHKGRLAQMLYGVGVVLVMLGLLTAPAYFLLLYLSRFPIAFVFVAAVMLKFTFSFRGLREAVVAIKGFLAQSELDNARIELRSLVSRDTADLDERQLVSAAVESVAENSCDSFVAPLLYFLIFGVPGAIAYRIVNTFDAMVGYHGKWEHLGKFAARLDDVLNFIPARITVLLIVLAAWLCRKKASLAWRVALRDHRKTESPNAGWTMSAVAGALGVQLEKAGHYKLGDNHCSLSLDTMSASLRMITVVVVLWSSISILAEVMWVVAT